MIGEGDFYRFAALEGYDFEKLKDIRFPKEWVEEYAKEPRVVYWNVRMMTHETDEKTKKLLKEYGRVDEIKASLIFPITSAEGVEGYITLDNFDSEDAFDSTDLKLAGIFQDHVRILLQKRDMERKMAYLASHDPLTGVLNRRAFRERVEKEMKRCERSGGIFGLVFLDLDEFKSVNDEHGHQCGDEVLKRVSETLVKNTRGSDEIGRLGGDEFAILLPDTDRSGLESFISRISRLIETTEVACDDDVVKIGASFGYALYPDEGGNFETLFRIADSRMYEKKR